MDLYSVPFLIPPLFQGIDKFIRFGHSVSVYASTLSILLVAVYQLITIRIDPFGARRIITTPRCLVMCIAAWVVSQLLSFPVIIHDNDKELIFINVGQFLILTTTGICYCLIYRAVAKGPGGGLEDPIAGRREENKRLLRTFGVVYGTTATIIIFALVFLDVSKTLPSTPRCSKKRIIQLFYEVLITSNGLANSIIYWWRLKEFRSILSACYHAKCGRAIVPVVQ